MFSFIVVDQALDTLFKLAEVPEESAEAQRNRFKDIYLSQLSNSDSSGPDSPRRILAGPDHNAPSTESSFSQNLIGLDFEDETHSGYGYEMQHPDLFQTYLQSVSTNTGGKSRFPHGTEQYNYRDYNQWPGTKTENSGTMGLDDINDTEKHAIEETFKYHSSYIDYENYTKNTQDFINYSTGNEEKYVVPHLEDSAKSQEFEASSGRTDYENSRLLHSGPQQEQLVGRSLLATGSEMNEFVPGQQMMLPRMFNPSITPKFTVPKMHPLYPRHPTYRYSNQSHVQILNLPQDTSFYSMNLQNLVNQNQAGFKTEYSMHRNLNKKNDIPLESQYDRGLREEIASPFDIRSPFVNVSLGAKKDNRNFRNASSQTT